MKTLALTLALFVFAAIPALAHSPLKSTVPADKASLKSAPEAIELVFAKPARVTKVVLSKDGAKSRLKLPVRKFVQKLTLNPDASGAGEYTVKWRALGEDGHVMKGEFVFTVAAD